MASGKLRIYKNPNLDKPRLLLGFSGWMDGGEVSTGTVECLVEKLGAERFAEIEPQGFYIYNFPGSMEMTALFRPHTVIKDGLIHSFEMPANWFFYDEKNNLILFLGKEPNMQWSEFAACIFELCVQFSVETMYFIGSVAGLVPHTREPRLICSVSEPQLKDRLRHYGVRFSNYQGPASFVTYLTTCAKTNALNMASFVATVPAYVQGNNPACIETVTTRLAGILNIPIELDDLRKVSEEFEKKLSEAVQEQPELAGNIRKLEEDYDNEIFDNEMGDLKNWLKQQGIRLD